MKFRIVLVAAVLSVAATFVWQGEASQTGSDRDNREALLRERYETLREAYVLVETEFETGEGTLESLARVSQSLCQAELAVARDKAQRIAACQRYVKDATKVEEGLRARNRIGLARVTDVLEAKAQRLTAQIQLVLARAGDGDSPSP